MEQQDLEHILRILTLAENAERISVVLGPASTDSELLAAHALKERLGEKAIILNAPEHLQDRWSHMFKKERPRKELVLLLDTNQHPVDQLRYEKEDGKLRILLSPHHELTKDAFTLEQRFPPSDMILALGYTNEEELSQSIKKDMPVKDASGVINLSVANRRAEAPEQQQNHISINAMKLWSRALLRSYVEDGLDVFWAFLPKEDFEKTNQTDDVLPSLVVSMRNIMDLPQSVIVLWQDKKNTHNNVHILISCADKDLLTRIAKKTETVAVNNVLIVRGFTNFSEAEVEAKKLIQQT
jgi:CDP-diacylglycerol pyrophosphatase